MKQILKLLLISLCLFTIEATAYVADRSPCLRDLQMNFFRPEIVNESLSLYSIPAGLWVPILNDLQLRSRDIPAIMKKMTYRRVPNPLEYPMDDQEAAKILKAALFQIFTDVMRRYYITEHPTLDYIFDYILYKELPRLVNCFGDQVRDLVPEFE
jgi:hypothetical protein